MLIFHGGWESVRMFERTSGVGEGCSNIVDRIAVGPVACLLVDKERIEEVLEKRGVGVDGDGMEWEYHCRSRVSR